MFQPNLKDEVWSIRECGTGKIVLSYTTHCGNTKKALFSDEQHARKALNNYFENPDNYYVCVVKGGEK